MPRCARTCFQTCVLLKIPANVLQITDTTSFGPCDTLHITNGTGHEQVTISIFVFASAFLHQPDSRAIVHLTQRVFGRGPVL